MLYTPPATFTGVDSFTFTVVGDVDGIGGIDPSAEPNPETDTATDHVRITTTSIRFGTGFSWFFNDVSNGGCTFSIAPTSVTVASDATSSSVAVTAGAGCGWTIVSNDAWITVTGGASGNGTVNYSVAANLATTQRIGTVTIAGQTFTVTQMAAWPTFTDDLLVLTVTPMRAVHIMELRARIDALLVGTYTWTKPHRCENDSRQVAPRHGNAGCSDSSVYRAAEQMTTHPGYTTGGGLGAPIQASHINELRQFVKDLESP